MGSIKIDEEIIAIILSFSSLIISFLALYFSILKSGRVKFNIYSHIKDAPVNIISTYKNYATVFMVNLPVKVKNNGANSMTVKDIQWKAVKSI